MSDRRFDNRSKDTFKKDIKFGTQVESFLFQQWLPVYESQGFVVESWDHNGVDNNGEYIETGKKTSGADYRVNGTPLEVKFVPTAGKFTLKIGDLKSYIKEGADILFIYNTSAANRGLKKPRTGYDIDKHLNNIKQAMDDGDIYWGIMHSDIIEVFMEEYSDKIFPIPYMGNKPGIVLPQSDFHRYIEERMFHVEQEEE